MKIWNSGGRTKKIEASNLFWIISMGFIFLLVIISFIIKDIPSLSTKSKFCDWIIIGILSHKGYFLPGLLVPILAIFIGSALGIFSSSIIGRDVIIKWFNLLSLCITDILESLPRYPTILLGILLIPKYYEHRLLWIMIILGILNASKISRIIKAKIDSLEKREYIEAAKSFGISTRRLVFVHILMYNCGAIFITQIALQMIDVILIEIGYTYISQLTKEGLSAIPTFGNMLVIGKDKVVLWFLPLLLVVFNILTFLNFAQIIEKKFAKKGDFNG